MGGGGVNTTKNIFELGQDMSKFDLEHSIEINPNLYFTKRNVSIFKSQQSRGSIVSYT